MALRDRILEIKKAYPGKQWADRVDKMTEAQLVAVYLRLKGKGII